MYSAYVSTEADKYPYFIYRHFHTIVKPHIIQLYMNNLYNAHYYQDCT